MDVDSVALHFSRRKMFFLTIRIVITCVNTFISSIERNFRVEKLFDATTLSRMWNFKKLSRYKPNNFVKCLKKNIKKN